MGALIHAAVHLARALLHHGHRSGNPLLQVLDHGLDLAGGLRGAPRQTAHLVRHHGKSTPLLTGARRLDGCIECQQVGLLGDAANDIEDVADLAAHAAHIANHFAGLLQLARQLMGGGDIARHHLASHLGGLLHIHHPLQSLVGGLRHLAYRGLHLGHGCGDRGGLLPLFLQIGPHRFGGMAVAVGGIVKLGRCVG